MSTLENSALWPFAKYAADLSPDDLPADALHAAKRCLLDWFAAALPGTVIEPATLLTAAFKDCIGRGGARLYPSGDTTDARTAAFINGAASHTVEFDDIYRNALYHPGVPVISAALAIAQARGVSGARLLTGIVAGYEVSNRLGAAANPAHYEFWHTTGTIGTFGAAAAAEQGVTGAPDILEGPRGFGNAMCLNGLADEQPDWARAAETLGRDYLIKQTTTKNHSACGHVHAAVDSVLLLAREYGLTADQVKEIRVGSYQKAEEICGNTNPQTAFEAKFSLVYCCAAALLWGSVRMAAFTPDRLQDKAVRDLMTRITLTTDPECQGNFPALRSAKVEIETTDGRVVSHYAPTRKGDPDAPLSDMELEDKYRDLASAVLGADGAESLLAAIWSIDALDSARDLVAAPAQAAQ